MANSMMIASANGFLVVFKYWYFCHFAPQNMLKVSKSIRSGNPR